MLDVRIGRLSTRLADTGSVPPRLIAVLVPEASGPMADEMAAALDERRELKEARARDLAEQAIQTQQSLMLALGPRPASGQGADQWLRQVEVVDAYRDRYAVAGSTPLGVTTDSSNKERDAALAAAAIRLARQRIPTRATPAAPPLRPLPERSGPTR